MRFPTTVAANGAAPPDPAMLYLGDVMHSRLKPVSHRFTYRVATLLIDLDGLDAANRQAAAFSVGRFNLFSFAPKDHGPRDGSDLRAHVDGLLAVAGAPRAHRVLLLCYPRVAGFVFNPLSVYFCLDEAGETTALVYEVRNTFGETHTYVAPVESGQAGPEGIRQARDKRFFVSPFMAMEHRYHFRVLPPGTAVRVRIMETDATGPTLAAAFSGRMKPLTSAALLAVFAAMPFHTLKVVAGIHFEALRLWLKGAPYFRRGRPPEPVSFGDGPDGVASDARTRVA